MADSARNDMARFFGGSMRHRARVASAVCATVFGLPAGAQTLDQEVFSDYDPFALGKVGLSEWVQHDWNTAVARYDANHDGHITKTEFVSGVCHRIEEGLKRKVSRCAEDVMVWFAVLDRDHDGELSRAENDAQSENLFRQNDRNHDGFVTAQEMQDAAKVSSRPR